MSKVIVLSQNYSETANTVIEWLQSSYGSQFKILGLREYLYGPLNSTQSILLFLSPNPDEWGEYVSPLAASLGKKQNIACIDAANQNSIQQLLGMNIKDIVTLPVDKEILTRKVKRLLNVPSFESVDELNKTIIGRHPGLHRFVGVSKQFLKSIENIPDMSKIDSPVLITGESGTGKELCARAIHYLGSRSDRPFIPLNCGTIPENLFENELFGHERGAYTDASTCQRGLLAEAQGGTLFLDEINSLPLSAQVKLLRFLEDGVFKPLGSAKYTRVDVRILCASNLDLSTEVRCRRFREDLYYRINVLNVDLPPLRTRKDDIVALAHHFLDKFTKQYNKGKMYFTPKALKALEEHNWSGNVRELKNIVERAVVKSPSCIINPSNLTLESHENLQKSTLMEFKVEKERWVQAYLQAVLEGNDWNVSKASRQAQIDRRSLQRLIKKYNLSAAA